MKKCATPECGFKSLNEFYQDRTRHDRKSQYCKECTKGRNRQRYGSDAPRRNKQTSLKYRQYKQEVMDHYGGVCACCGEHRIEFLTLDHVHQDGAKYRKELGTNASGYNFYLWLRRNNYPKLGLQVLCSNCNTGRGAYSECPHVRERQANLIDGLGI